MKGRGNGPDLDTGRSAALLGTFWQPAKTHYIRHMRSIDTLKALFLTAFGSLFGAASVHATHIVGGEMYYDHLGGSQYQVTVKLYRDCTGIAFDNPIRVGVYNAVTNQFLFSQNIPFPGATNVPVELDNPCLSVPPSVCVEVALYTSVFTLPPNNDGYIISTQRCCRTPIIVNIPNPGNQGLTVMTRVPGVPVAENNSARFIELPPIALCLNEPLVFDHSAFDPDGDQLTYELCTPFNGGTGGNANPIPSQATAPPYAFIPWLGPTYSAIYPIDSDPAISIDPVTGLLTLTPTQIGSYVVGVCVNEFRDGQLLNVTRRDFLFEVVPCNASVTSAILAQQVFCQGLTMNFGNNSVGASEYFWDFGDPSTDADTSNLATPSWTYAEPGTYTVTLIANPGLVCADTATAIFEVYETPIPFFQVPDSLCGNSEVTFLAEGTYYDYATFLWNFGGNASPPTSTDQEATATFPPTGTHGITLTISQNNCVASYSDQIVVNPFPTAAFFPDPISPQLAGTIVDFIDQSTGNGSSIVSWQWEANGVPIGEGPFISWDNTLPGDYTVQLVVTTLEGCTDTTTIFYTIFAGDVEIPNVFTPNGDGVNDFFVIENAQYYQNTLNIYNRWGMPVFTTNNYRNTWRGTELPDGTYYYVFTLADGREFTGHVTLLR